MNQSTTNFLLLFVGACLALAGVGLFFAVADMDYHVSYVETRESLPPGQSTAYYDSLTPIQQAAFDGAKDGGVVTVEEDIDFPEIVAYQDRYYYFSYYSSFDWLNPYTAGPTLLSLFGAGVVVTAMRRDIRNRGVY